MLECTASSSFNGEDMGARIASVFVLLAVSAFGSFFPLLSVKFDFLRLPGNVLYVVKHFGTGVILATAYIHLLGESQTQLTNGCLTGIWSEYSWSAAFCLMGTFTMFSIELFIQQLVNRRYKRKAERARLELESILKLQNESTGSEETIAQATSSRLDKFSSDKLSSDDSDCEDDDREPPFKKVLNLFLLEFGIVFHSVFVGLSLAIAGEEFKTLFVAISFHQFFEGLGLASRFATTQWPSHMKLVPWIFSLIYSLTTPVGIAAGLGVRHLYLSNATGSLIVVGVFDGFCSGLLIYNCLVELMAQDFLMEREMRDGSASRVTTAYVLLVVGTVVMALIGRWA